MDWEWCLLSVKSVRVMAPEFRKLRCIVVKMGLGYSDLLPSELSFFGTTFIPWYNSMLLTAENWSAPVAQAGLLTARPVMSK